MAIILDSFSHWEFSLLDPIHQFPWALAFICDFLDLVVKESLFGVFNCCLVKNDTFCGNYRRNIGRRSGETV